MKLFFLSVIIFSAAISKAQYPAYFEEKFDVLSVSVNPVSVSGISPRFQFEVKDPCCWQGLNRVDVSNYPDTRLGNGAIKLTVAPGDTVSKKNRSEIKIFNNDPLNSEVWYGWSCMVPVNFQDNNPNLFQYMGQFHDQPDTTIGQNWNNYPSHGPMIAIRYGYQGTQCGFIFDYGIDTVINSIQYNKGHLDTVLITKGQWNDIIFHIKWAADGSGFLEGWMNGVPLGAFNGTDYKIFGPNMYNSMPAYLKLGLYRAWGFTTVNSVYYDEIRIGSSKFDVALSAEVEKPEYFFSIYPNPIREIATLSIKNQYTEGGSLQLRIFDLIGCVVYQQAIHAEETAFTPDLAAGVYFAEVRRAGSVIREKIIVAK